MMKRIPLVIAVLGTCLLSQAAFARLPVRARVGVDGDRTRAEASAQLEKLKRKAVTKADRAARAAGVRVTVQGKPAKPQRRAVQRRDAMRRAVAKRLVGGDLRPGRR